MQKSYFIYASGSIYKLDKLVPFNSNTFYERCLLHRHTKLQLSTHCSNVPLQQPSRKSHQLLPVGQCRGSPMVCCECPLKLKAFWLLSSDMWLCRLSQLAERHAGSLFSRALKPSLSSTARVFLKICVRWNKYMHRLNTVSENPFTSAIARNISKQ